MGSFRAMGGSLCSIIGSFSKDKIRELVKLNQHRGNFSFSVYSDMFWKNFGEFDETYLNEVKDGNYIFVHLQAPTGGLVKETSRIHPIVFNNNLLWHNGIITESGIEFLQEQTNSKETFDTYLLVKALAIYDSSILSEIEGLFSCVWKNANDEYFVFRSKHGKLYVDDELSISSERFENSKCINSDTVYKIDWEQKRLVTIGWFKTKSFNFIIKGEL